MVKGLKSEAYTGAYGGSPPRWISVKSMFSRGLSGLMVLFSVVSPDLPPPPPQIPLYAPPIRNYRTFREIVNCRLIISKLGEQATRTYALIVQLNAQKEMKCLVLLLSAAQVQQLVWDNFPPNLRMLYI